MLDLFDGFRRYVAVAPPGGPVIVQIAPFTGQYNPAVFASPTTIGNRIIIIGCSQHLEVWISADDNGGNAYSVDIVSSPVTSVGIMSALVTSPSTIINMRGSMGNDNEQVCAIEVSGLAAIGQPEGTGQSNTVGGAAATSAAANALFVSASTSLTYSTPDTPGFGWTIIATFAQGDLATNIVEIVAGTYSNGNTSSRSPFLYSEVLAVYTAV